MKNFFLLVLCIGAALLGSAQHYTNQNKVWAFGNGAGLDFNPGMPVPFTSSMFSGEGAATICNSAGNLLFYTDGHTVYNRLGIIMPGGAAVVPFPTYSSTQGAAIMPFIDDANKYYLFSLEQRETGGGQIAYSVIDMTLDGGMGDVVPGSSGVVINSGMSEKMIVVPGTSCNAWLITHKNDLPEFYAYEITPTGISTTPVVSYTGTFTGINSYAIGTIKCSHDKQKIALSGYSFGTSYGLELYDFDAATGLISNCRVLETTTNHYGAEFSPDNTRLYAGLNPTYQWDVSLSSTAAIIASRTAIGTSTGTNLDMRLAPDGKIYIAKGGGTILDRINFPNATGTACGYVANAVNLSPNVGRYCFPNEVWNVRTISGSAAVCAGATTTFSTILSGGTWSSTDAAIATISAAGVVTGIAPGTTTISYATGTGCDGALIVTVVAMPAITGLPVCVGNATALTGSTGAGTWTSSATGVATVGLTSGIVTGVAAGTASITYNSPGCPAATATITVNTLSVTGGSSVCTGATLTLSSATPGGTWTSSDNTIGTVSAAGVVTGISSGTTLISYRTGSGCIATHIVSVNLTPVIVFSGMLCVGSTMTLSSPIPGGTWSTGGSSLAIIGLSTGILQGLLSGAVTVTYTSPAGCTTTEVIPVGSPVFSVGTICVGGTTTLSAPTSSGIWYSSTPPVATVGVSSGIVTGVAPGTAVITYSLWAGCAHTATVTVTLAIPPGNLDLCTGTTGTVSGSVPGGAWSSSNTAVATVGAATGIVTAVSAGTAILSYVNSGQCLEVANVTISQSPPAITGPTTVCTGGTVTLSNTMAGGTWSSTSSIATIGSTTGVLTGIAPGFVSITYTAPGNSCYVVRTDTVNVCKTGIQAGQPSATVVIYPNPANDELYISIGEHAPVSFAIYNALGQVVMGGNVNSGETKVNVKALPAGEYRVVFDGDGVRTVGRFVKW